MTPSHFLRPIWIRNHLRMQMEKFIVEILFNPVLILRFWGISDLLSELCIFYFLLYRSESLVLIATLKSFDVKIKIKTKLNHIWSLTTCFKSLFRYEKACRSIRIHGFISFEQFWFPYSKNPLDFSITRAKIFPFPAQISKFEDFLKNFWTFFSVSK